eukprot:6178229-Pleurochrysis_carterae.AAC.1
MQTTIRGRKERQLTKTRYHVKSTTDVAELKAMSMGLGPSQNFVALTLIRALGRGPCIMGYTGGSYALTLPRALAACQNTKNRLKSGDGSRGGTEHQQAEAHARMSKSKQRDRARTPKGTSCAAGEIVAGVRGVESARKSVRESRVRPCTCLNPRSVRACCCNQKMQISSELFGAIRCGMIGAMAAA